MPYSLPDTRGGRASVRRGPVQFALPRAPDRRRGGLWHRAGPALLLMGGVFVLSLPFLGWPAWQFVSDARRLDAAVGMSLWGVASCERRPVECDVQGGVLTLVVGNKTDRPMLRVKGRLGLSEALTPSGFAITEPVQVDRPDNPIPPGSFAYARVSSTFAERYPSLAARSTVSFVPELVMFADGETLRRPQGHALCVWVRALYQCG